MRRITVSFDVDDKIYAAFERNLKEDREGREDGFCNDTTMDGLVYAATMAFGRTLIDEQKKADALAYTE